ncbi:hypothetical protein [Sphingomonas sp. 28-63-12]|uniref:hypothetical protein n=1 Tax=Sphingomonas sp. 28-63-12 TaxID=1970434 RepID=UPI000BD14C5E|nr:MAG: hypothetical protein B7Y47_00125 [Sphingomonas sp. 28-63-12]
MMIKQLYRIVMTMAASVSLSIPLWAQLTQPPQLQQTNGPQADILVVGDKDQARSKWVRAESRSFTVYSVDDGEARREATKLERFDQLLQLLTQTPAQEPANPLPVYLVPGTSQILQLRRQYLPPRFFPTGYYSAAPTGIILAADMHWDKQVTKIPAYHDVWLFTEYSRHFLLQNARGAFLPAWYVDGFSLTLSSTRFTGNAVEYGQGNPTMIEWLKNEKWAPIRNIIAGELDQGQLYSAESALLVHYILADPARGKAFGRFLDAARHGAEPVAAFEAAFRTTMKSLQAALWRYRYEATYIRASFTGTPDPAIVVSHLPKSADALLLDQAAMRIGIPEPDRQRAVLQRAENAVADRSDPFAQRVLAMAQILYGVPERADAALDALLIRAPADPELLYLKGLRHLAAGRRDAIIAPAEFLEARKWFARAYQANPDYYPALYGWVESLSTEPQFLSVNSLNVLVKAAQLAPQATQIRITAATMLMTDGMFEDAEALLAPITVTPRDPASKQIPALLAQSRARQRPDRAQLLASFRFNATWADLNCC